MVTYKVLRDFRVPANGGVQVPYRDYPAGTTVTSAEIPAADLAILLRAGRLVELASAPPPPAPTAQEAAEIADLEKHGFKVEAPAG